MENKFLNIHQDLIDKCKEKNQKAQFQIYKLYYQSMFNTCFRIVNKKSHAEDIMQEAFLIAFEKISTYSNEVSFGAWLKKIVVNKSLDHLRKQKYEFETFEEEIHDFEDDIEIAETDNNKTAEKLKNIIQSLPDKYRIVFSLYHLEGYDHDEISKIMNITASTSRSQLTRAKQKIIEMMKFN